MIVVKESDWRRIGLKYYLDVKDFEFKCPSCKHKQSVNSVLKHNPNLEEKEVRDFIVMDCEGRYTEHEGCDWCLGGLFQIHEIEIMQEDGKRFPVFEFANYMAMEELSRLAIDVSKIEEKKKRLTSGTLWICVKDFEAQPSSMSSHSPRFIRRGDIIEFRYFHPANFRTIEDKYYQVNEGLFLECCDIYGIIFKETNWQNRESLKEILEKKLFQPEIDDVKLLKEYFEECEYKSDGKDCSCGKVGKGERLWFEKGTYEYPDDGNIFCDICGLLEIKKKKDEEEFYGSKEFEDIIEKEEREIISQLNSEEAVSIPPNPKGIGYP